MPTDDVLTCVKSLFKDILENYQNGKLPQKNEKKETKKEWRKNELWSWVQTRFTNQ